MNCLKKGEQLPDSPDSPFPVRAARNRFSDARSREGLPLYADEKDRVPVSGCRSMTSSIILRIIRTYKKEGHEL